MSNILLSDRFMSNISVGGDLSVVHDHDDVLPHNYYSVLLASDIKPEFHETKIKQLKKM